MIPEILLVVAGTLGLGSVGGWWWMRRASRDHVIRTRTAWVRAGMIIRYGPVGALCLGHTPRAHAAGGVVGALGITAHALHFDGWRARHHDRDIPLEGIRHILVGRVRAGRGPVARARVVVRVLHQDDEQRWHESAFVVDDPAALAAALADRCGAPVHDDPDSPLTYGPDRAARLDLSDEGDWLTVREGDLYLAPGLLIFNWAESLPLDRVAYLDVVGGARPVLRIELHDGSVTGFEVDDPGAWADAIHAQSDVPIARHGM